MKYDEKTTAALQAFASRTDTGTPAWGRDAAEWILRLTGDRFLAARTGRNPALMARKAQAVISSRLQMRLDNVTREEVRRMESGTKARAAQSVEDTPPAQWDGKGKRRDHDKLPAKVQALYGRGGELYRKMKEIFETLRQMENAAPCDRYELLKMLGELDAEYRHGWELYDHYSDELSALSDDPPAATPSSVAAARKWITVNLPRIEAEAAPDRLAALKAKLRQKAETVKQGGGGFKPATGKRISALLAEG